MSTDSTPQMSHGKISPTILLPLPDHDFDPTESSIPWLECHSRGWQVIISTEHGMAAECDQNRFKGPFRSLRSVGSTVQAAYKQFTLDPSFQHPIPYAEIDPSKFDAILLPGGDGLRMRQYLESQVLQAIVLQFNQQGKLIGAICHGILVAARTIDPHTGHSVLFGHKLTILPKSMDQLKYQLDAKFFRNGYIMYPSCVEDEVTACLEHKEDYLRGPGLLAPYVVSDGNLVTARYYSDAQVFARRFVEMLQKRISQP